MSRVHFSVAMTAGVDEALLRHLLQHYSKRLQEDLCFALWRPSQGRSRRTALICEVIVPRDGERQLHGNASFGPAYFDRVVARALEEGAGVAFLHSHPGPGWQSMSPDDVIAEERLAPRVFGATGLPLVGLTAGSDGAWSARFWMRRDRSTYERHWCGSVRVVGEEFKIFFADGIAPPPSFREELKRTISAWGDAKNSPFLTPIERWGWRSRWRSA